MFIKDGNFIYFIGWCAYNLFYKIFHNIKVEGLEKLPQKGGYIIASNHISALDPPAIGSVLPKAIYFMAKRELFGNPVFSWILTKVNSIPVNRSGVDIQALRGARRVLKGGKTLLIFPQGGRRSGLPQPDKAKGGLSMLAFHEQVPVVPCAIISPKNVKEAKGITIKFSDPVYPSGKGDKSDYEAFSSEVIGRIREMLGS
ncbi:MAG: lysophospholipid acyltransferase family protein [Elusimicrobiota bacterium]